jgi:hypothetical protein
MDKSKTPRHEVRKRHDLQSRRGVLDLSIVQGPFFCRAVPSPNIHDSRLLHRCMRGRHAPGGARWAAGAGGARTVAADADADADAAAAAAARWAGAGRCSCGTPTWLARTSAVCTIRRGAVGCTLPLGISAGVSVRRLGVQTVSSANAAPADQDKTHDERDPPAFDVR